MIRIYADFNCIDEQDRVTLNTVGSLKDIERHRSQLKEGLKAIFYMTNEFEVRGTLTFDRIWRGIPDWTTIRHYNPKD